MKPSSWIIVALGILVSSNAPNNRMETIRNTYRKALTQPKSIHELKSLTKHKKDAISTAFFAMALALDARESSWVPNKISLAKEAYTYLNKAVSLDPNNFEIRYLRFSFSCEVPSMLNLSEHIHVDKAYILKHARKGEALEDIMKKYFLKSSCLNPSEKEQLLKRL